MERKQIKGATFQTLDETYYLGLYQGIEMWYEEQNLGDHGIGWVIVFKNDIEVGRHNTRYAVCIDWKVEENNENL